MNTHHKKDELQMDENIKIMQRLKRDPMRFDVLDLFDSIGRSKKFVLGKSEDNASFVQLISESLAGANTDSMIYGRRTEAMFSYVAASLGKCLLIKKEDAGDVISSSLDIIIPDYRVVLEDGSQLLVEVKNYRQQSAYDDYTIKTEYLDRIIRYSQIIDSELFFAVYWSLWDMWTLVSVNDFQRSDNTAILPFHTAIKRNYMGRLGDVHIGTTPPLSIRIYTNKGKPHSVNHEGVAEFVIGSVEIRCKQSVITLDNERRIAMAIMMYGNWAETSRAYYSDEHLREIDYIEFSYSPEECNEEQGFSFVDSISTIISRQYSQLTAPNGKVERLTPNIAPGMLGFIVPEAYKSDVLPLWRIHQQAYYE